MTDRELLQEALNALTYVGDKEIYSDTIEALRARLSQSEPAECDGGQCGIGGYCKQCPKTQPENEFNPDWDALPVMVEEQQRMAKRIEELTQLVTSQNIRLMDAEAQSEQEPQSKEWVGLTGEELQEIYQSAGTVHFKFAMVEAKLKEKNT